MEDKKPQNSLWWGYRHSAGSVQAKRFLDSKDIDEAHASPFCESVVGPFAATSREEAIKRVRELTS